MTFATLEGYPEGVYVSFSGSFDEKAGEITFSVLTDTRQVYGLGQIGPSRTVQESQWEIVIGNVREILGEEKKDVKESSNIQEFEYDENKPMGKGKQTKNETTTLNE